MDCAIASTAARAEQNRDKSTEIKGKDGLIHCAKCGGARQTILPVHGKNIMVFCLCKCMTEARDSEAAALKEREERARMEQNINMNNLDVLPTGYSFENDDNRCLDLSRMMRNYAHRFPVGNKGLILYGGVGTGKSFYMGCIVHALRSRGIWCLYTRVQSLVNAEKNMDIDAFLRRFSLVALDDLGTERETSYMNEKVYSVIDMLYNANIPLLVTTNCDPRHMTNEEDLSKSRIYDRLLERCYPVAVTGPSRRIEAGRRNYARITKLLSESGL